MQCSPHTEFIAQNNSVLNIDGKQSQALLYSSYGNIWVQEDSGPLLGVTGGKTQKLEQLETICCAAQ